MNSDSVNFVEVVAQGFRFRLDANFVLGIDWKLAILAACNMISERRNNVIQLDLDHASFRLLLSVLQGFTELSDEFFSFLISSRSEWIMFKSTVIHLQCSNILQKIICFEQCVAGSAVVGIISDKDISRSEVDTTAHHRHHQDNQDRRHHDAREEEITAAVHTAVEDSGERSNTPSAMTNNELMCKMASVYSLRSCWE
jgi:hypothetical protein